MSHVRAILVALCLAALACSVGAPAGVSPTAPPAGPEAVAATPTPQGPPPPTSFDDVLLAEVESGRATYEEALIALLRSFLGEGLEDLPEGTDRALTREGNAITERAHEYLATGTDDAAKAEIERLLALLVPSPEALAAYSIPEEQARGTAGLARPAAQEDCAALWRRGFPLDGAYPCFVYRLGSAGGGAFGVYYPTAWPRDDPRREFLEATAEAAGAAMDSFSTYGEIGPVTLIFSLVPGTPTFLAETFSHHAQAGESCPILIYESALAYGIDNFKQTVAHEVFHCWQVTQLTGQMRGVVRADRMWWSEATAEYFSNTVYDEVDFEFRFADEFHQLSGGVPATSLGYTNAIFFQFLANELGDAEVIRLLRAMPEAGGSEQQLAALAAVPDIADLYHRFGEAYLDQQIRDTGGEMWPGVPDVPYGEGGLRFPQDSGQTLAAAAPFVLARWGVEFEPDKVYTISAAEGGAPGLFSVRLGGPRSGWGVFPPWLNSACPMDPIVLLVTNTTPGDASHEVTVTTEIEDEDDVECDPCLLGTWQLDLDSYRTAFEAISPSLPGEALLEEVSGGMTGSFLPTGLTEGTLNLFVSLEITDDDGETSVMEMRMAGTSRSAYSVDGAGGLLVRPIEESIGATFALIRDGRRVEVPVGPIPPPTFVSGTYVCEGDRLHITPEQVDPPEGPVQDITVHPGLDYVKVDD